MKVSEIREKTKVLEKDVVVELLVKAYQHVPKGKREELDQMILSGDTKGTKKKTGDALPPEDFHKIKEQVELFIENAVEGNYIKPNRVVPKAKRSKWRFEAKNAYKSLVAISEDDPNFAEAGKLLQGLYDILSRACGYWVFTSDDPFRATGIAQTEFFHAVCEKRLRAGISKETIDSLLSSIINGYVDRETLTISLYAELGNVLKTADAKYLAIDCVAETIRRIKNGIDTEKTRQSAKKYKSYSNLYYRQKDAINSLCEFVEMLSIYLGEPEDGAKFFWQYQAEDNKEIALYRLLQTIAWFSEDNREWIRVYEDAVERLKIKPRDSLKELYNEKKAK